jgi:predicted MPP superfamily phosphohydrolase
VTSERTRSDAGVSRRDALAGALAGGIAAIAGGSAFGLGGQAEPGGRPADGAGSPQRPSRVARIAHLTDVHVQPEREAEAGFAACLRHVQSLGDRPDLIVTGGDNVMDVFETERPRTEVLRRLWKDVLARECSLRVEPTIGNHDIWGWHKDAKVKDTDPLFGKAYALDLLGLKERYRSFDLAAPNGRVGGVGGVGGDGAGTWQVIVLDSIQRRPNSYRCGCDPEQRAWLEATLAAKPKGRPTLVVSHAPVLSITTAAHSAKVVDDDLRIGGDLMHMDGRSLHELFKRNDVKLCLSGHMHLLDRCDVDGVSYLCDGAVSGGWWKGDHRGVREGYGVVDLFADGSFAHRYETYGWQARG